jgi:outer membrane receptor for ferric coprogen and ferric-rhodotorulic acid
VRQWASQVIPRPSYPGAYLAASEDETLYRFYAAAHLSLTDKLKVIAGFNALKLEASGVSYGTDRSRDEERVSPYLGAVYDITGNVSAYASYTDIFNPQAEVDIAGAKLPPAHGTSLEAGLKSQWLNNRLYVTAAIFKSQQQDLAEWAGVSPITFRDYYAPIDVEITGYEIEAVGQLSDRVAVSAGWTDLNFKDDVRPYVPRQTFKATATYVVPELKNLKLGAGLRWQSEIGAGDVARIEQDAYAELDLMAGVDVTERVRATFNIKNATDEKHLTSLMWNQSYYAAPRSYSVRLDVSF